MAYTFVRDGVIYVRWKNSPGRTPKWPTTTENTDTGRPFATEREAKRWGGEQEVKAKLGLLDEPEPEEPPADGVTVGEWFARWWLGLDVGIRSRGNYSYYFRVYVLPEWQDWKLADITASEVNGWEQRLIAAGYKRGGVPAHARAALCTLLGDAVTERLLGSNPAVRQRNRGRRSGIRPPEDDKVWSTPLDTILVAERAALLSGRDDEFVLATLIGWTGLRWGEAAGLQRSFVSPGRIRVDWQMEEIGGRWYLLPPKDDSHRTLDSPRFLQQLLDRQAQARAEQRCGCEPHRIDGQQEQPCQGGGYMFLGPKGAHLSNSRFARSYFNPAADGRYPTSSGSRTVAGKPVLVDVAETWPGVPVPAWPRAVPGVRFEPPAGRGYQRRPVRLGVNAASSREALVAYAVGQGVGETAAAAMTRQEILDRFVRPHRDAGSAVLASWLPVRDGLTLHGLRHGHSTLLDGLRTPLKLRDDRIGHASPEMRRGGMRRRYTHIADEWRKQLRQDLQEVWETALAERAGFGLHSPVTVVDDLLAPFRDGRRLPISPVGAEVDAEVVPLHAVHA
jgi:integrase